jgi:hypothetical protein
MQIEQKEIAELELIAKSLLTQEGDKIVAIDWSFATNEYFTYKNEVFKYLIHRGVLSILEKDNFGLLGKSKSGDLFSLNPSYRVTKLYFTSKEWAENYAKSCYADVTYPISIIQYKGQIV